MHIITYLSLRLEWDQIESLSVTFFKHLVDQAKIIRTTVIFITFKEVATVIAVSVWHVFGHAIVGKRAQELKTILLCFC